MTEKVNEMRLDSHHVRALAVAGLKLRLLLHTGHSPLTTCVCVRACVVGSTGGLVVGSLGTPVYNTSTIVVVRSIPSSAGVSPPQL